MRRGILTSAIVSVLAASAVAQPALAAPANALSLTSSVRAATSADDESLGQMAPAIGVVLGVVGIIAGAVIVVSDDEDSPASP